MNKTYLLLDNQPLFADAIEFLINKELNPQQVIRCRTTSEAYKYLKQEQVDLLITDVELEDGSGIEMVKRAKISGFAGQVLFISSKNYEAYSSMARSIGAQGYVSKTETQPIIMNAINTVKLGYSFFKSSVTTDLQDIKLSKRELSVLNYLQQGYSNRQISDLLALSEKTISTYKSRILKKYKAKSLVHLLNLNHSSMVL